MTSITNRIPALMTGAALMAVLVFAGCATTAPTAPPGQAEAEAKRAASNLFLEGKMAEVTQDWGTAIASYLEALQYDPESDEIAIALARAFIQDDKLRSALVYTRKAAELNPGEPSYLQILQYLEERDGDIAAAAETLKSYMKLVPDHEIMHDIKLAQYDFLLQRPKEAREILMERARDPHTPAEDMYEIAGLLAFNGERDAAVDVYRILLERDPLDVQAWLFLGDLYESGGDTGQALDTYQRALDANPDNIWVIISIGNHCLAENDWECAVTYFERAYDAGPDALADAGIEPADLARSLTSVYYYAGREERATALRDSLIAAGEDTPEFYFSLGKAMNYLDRDGEAADYYEDAFSSDVSDLPQESLFTAFVGYARALINTGREEDALTIVREIAPNLISDTSSLKELEASIYMEMERYSDAQSIYEWLLAADPENRSYRMSLSLVYDLSGQYGKAEEMLQGILDEDPEDHLALNNLAYMYLEQGQNLEKALKMVQQALIYAPDNGAYLDTLGWAYYLLGKYKEARDYIEKAIQAASPEDVGVIYEHYGDVLLKLDEPEQAREAYEAAIKNGEDESRIREKINGIR